MREKEELRMTQTRKRASLVAQMVSNLPAMQKSQIQPRVQEDPLDGKPLQYSCLENSVDREAWWATVHVVAKSQT